MQCYFNSSNIVVSLQTNYRQEVHLLSCILQCMCLFCTSSLSLTAAVKSPSVRTNELRPTTINEEDNFGFSRTGSLPSVRVDKKFSFLVPGNSRFDLLFIEKQNNVSFEDVYCNINNSSKFLVLKHFDMS